MDHETTLDSNMGSGLELTSEGKNYLQETSKWAKFIAIVYFVFIGLLALMMLFAGSFMTMMGAEMPGANGAAMGMAMFFYFLFIGAFIFFPALYLYKFSNHTKRALASESTAEFTEGLKNMKSYWKFMGIIMLVFIVLYGLAFVVMAIGGGMAAMMG